MTPEILSAIELERKYTEFIRVKAARSLDLSSWLPSFRHDVRPLVPGELAVIMADTGQGKSMALQNIALSCTETVLMFQLELPGVMIFERFMQAIHELTGPEMEARAKEGMYQSVAAMQHIFVCDQTRLSMPQMASIIMEHAPAKIGTKPFVVMVDYIGLMHGEGRSRYERTSALAEDLKVLAKECDCIVLCATQMKRKEDESEPDLHDAKESGSIENSCGLLLGMWRDNQDAKTTYIKVLKNTKGSAGKVIKCNIDGARMRITERSFEDVTDNL